MLKRMPKPHSQRRNATPTRASAHSPQAPHTFELVDLRWILKALAGTVALALLCGYVTLCLLYYRNQWQLALHPSREVTKTPAALGLAFTEVHFGAVSSEPVSSGQPELDGWWIPSDLSSDPSVILLHNGDDTISGALPIARNLHDARLNVLLFDYRGYGRSGGQYPTESTMEADAESAFRFLTADRGIPASSVLAYGNGVGGSLAVTLCTAHPQIAALILEAPDGDHKAHAVADSRFRFLPVRLLFHEDFPIAEALHTLQTPKLLISYSVQAAPAPVAFQDAADPKMTVELPVSPTSSIHDSLSRFLSAYVARPPATLSPHP
jgi:pimeloyl-ACP methyl ester carboxylesterase